MTPSLSATLLFFQKFGFFRLQSSHNAIFPSVSRRKKITLPLSGVFYIAIWFLSNVAGRAPYITRWGYGLKPYSSDKYAVLITTTSNVHTPFGIMGVNILPHPCSALATGIMPFQAFLKRREKDKQMDCITCKCSTSANACWYIKKPQSRRIATRNREIYFTTTTTERRNHSPKSPYTRQRLHSTRRKTAQPPPTSSTGRKPTSRLEAALEEYVGYEGSS